jgi:cytochrome bd ubiquinol oxidase subunit II
MTNDLHAYNLTVSNSASGGCALKVMTIVTVLFLPIVLLYQGWSFHVFRGRVTAPPASPQPPAPEQPPAT